MDKTDGLGKNSLNFLNTSADKLNGFVQSSQGQKIIKKGDAVPSKFKIDF